KADMLLRYLNTAYFGAGAYGVDAAARRYFGKKASELGLSEAAMLAGLVRAPSQLAPTRNFGGARQRQELVLQAMVDTKAITAAEAQAALVALGKDGAILAMVGGRDYEASNSIASRKQSGRRDRCSSFSFT